jgi:hypothetical protein
MAESDETPKIQIDSDWKAQAQAEKQRLAEQSKAAPPAPGSQGKASDGAGTTPGSAGATSGVPEANFETLLSSIITQALFAMGAIPDPQTGQPVLELDLARHQIDLLSVLETKTKGNLSDDESKMLSGALYELRSRYVQVASASRGG